MGLKKRKIIKTLKTMSESGIEWSLLMQERKSVSLYFTKGGEPETGITATRKQGIVTIYKHYGKQMGDAHFTIFSDDESVLKKKIKEAVQLTRLSKKRPYPLATKKPRAKVELADEKIRTAFEKDRAEGLLMIKWRAILKAYGGEKGLILNSAELAISSARVSVTNSKGVDTKTDATIFSVEIFSTAKRGSKEQEFMSSKTFRRVSDLSPREFVKENIRYARDSLVAKKFKGVQEGKIILVAEALRDFWSPQLDLSPMLFHASAGTKYKKLSLFTQEKQVISAPITIISNPLLSFNESSSAFDEDGVPSKRVVIIDKGIFKNFLSSQRYAHYLGVKPTGAVGAVELSLGEEREEDLREDGTIEIRSFSSFVPNSLSGDFSAEIRLGYLYKHGKRIPLRGAMFSGSVFKMLSSMRSTNSRFTTGGYTGPSMVRFDASCTIAGF